MYFQNNIVKLDRKHFNEEAEEDDNMEIMNNNYKMTAHKTHTQKKVAYTKKIKMKIKKEQQNQNNIKALHDHRPLMSVYPIHHLHWFLLFSN